MSKKIGPHTYKLGEGQVTFSYMTKAEADEHFKAIKSKAPPEPAKTNSGIGSLTPSANNHLALGLAQTDAKEFKIVTIEYNLDTLESVIQSVELAASTKAYARKAYQAATIKKNIIK